VLSDLDLSHSRCGTSIVGKVLKECPSAMEFEDRIRNICEELVACTSQAESLVLCKRLQALMHERIEETRKRAQALPFLDSSNKAES